MGHGAFFLEYGSWRMLSDLSDFGRTFFRFLKPVHFLKGECQRTFQNILITFCSVTNANNQLLFNTERLKDKKRTRK